MALTEIRDRYYDLSFNAFPADEGGLHYFSIWADWARWGVEVVGDPVRLLE